MSASDSATLVSVKWLADHLAAPDVRIVDASWYLPSEQRDPKAEYAAAHIPGAVYFDIDDICDERSSLPHMVPPMAKFVSRVRRLGVGDGHRIIVYDGAGIYSAARVWWMFRYFGHRDVSVLDGGFAAWRAAGLEIEDLPPPPRERHFTPRIQTMLIRDVTEVSEALKTGSAQIVDARSAERFKGLEAEPREGVRSGHMPGSLNVHYRSLLNDEGSMVADEVIKQRFSEAGVDLARPIITTCGSGVTAAILNLALERIGHRAHALYDGSWAEWGASPMLPVETA
ncbi:MAG: 3-mercaptopyruvate sulfurtransferase [Neomegalonema sp.]|nr:3-mercaptopyruvate sulfurtransferase [Neomegalonema sp.]